MMFGEMLKNVRKLHPIVHNITNYVTVNDCANIVLACGASPIMADDFEEVCEITAICNTLNINIGTLNSRTIKSMLAAGKKSRQLGHPVVLDPVGAGASELRTKTAVQIVDEVRPDVIKGNISEIKTIAAGQGSTAGVDASEADAVNENNIDSVITFVKSFAGRTGSVIAVTGAVDIVADSERAYVIRNGHEMMSKVTGTGCMLSAMTSAYIAANPGNTLIAAAASVCAMGLCGELAYERLSEREGNSTYRNYIIDEINNLTPGILEEGAKYEIK